MKHRRRSSYLIIIFSLVFFTTTAHTEFIFLKDGSITEGTVIKDNGESFFLKDSSKNIKVISRKNIIRILYTEFSMEKIYIQKRNGEALTAYMVDEDRKTYTFRKVINNPEEFTLKRGEILFIADKNPSGLTGTPGLTHVKLSWYAPYDLVKKYNLYIKTNEALKYTLAGTSQKNNFILEDLTPGTTYTMIVRCLDKDNYESPPSNEFQFTTVQPSSDNIGDIKMEKARILDRQVTYRTSICPSYSIPFQNLGKMVSPGYGPIIDLAYCNFILNNLDAGIRTGLLYFPGRKISGSIAGEQVNYLLMTPTTALASYRFRLFHFFTLTPSCGAGYCLTYGHYKKLNNFSANTESAVKTSHDLIIQTGVSLDFDITKNIFATVSGAYHYILEPDKDFGFAIFSAGFGYKFY